MKKSKDRLPGSPYNGYGYPQNGYGYPQDGYNGYGGYQQEGYPKSGYPQNNGYQQNGYGSYPGYGGYGGYPGYGYPGYGGYGGYGGYPQMNYIADNYPHEDYGNPNDPNDQSVRHDSEHGARQSEEPAAAQPKPSAPASEPVPEPEAPAAPEEPAEASAPQAAEEKRDAPPAEEPKPSEPSSYPASENQSAQASGEGNAAGAETDSGSGDVETLSAEAADLKRKWYSVTAEYENYRKRTQNVRVEAYQEGRADIVKKLFPIGDNLDRAVKSCQDETTRKGIEMVLSAFEKLLESENITVIDPVGQPFDPNECEAIMAVDPSPEQESGIVTEVYVKGYVQNEKVLRYAQVIVTK